MIVERIDEQVVARIVRDSDIPLTAKRIAKAAFGATNPKTVEEVAEVLEGLQRAGHLHRFPPEQKGWAARFGSRPPVQWVRTRILNKVQDDGGKVTQKQVIHYLHKWECKYYDEAVGGLVKDGRLYYLTVRYKYLVSFPPAPSDYLLQRQVTALNEILERINRRRSNPISFEELKSFLDGSSSPATVKAKASGELTEEMLREWHKEDLPRLGGMTSVPIPWTWGRYETWCKDHGFRPEPNNFHGFLRHLLQAGKIDLIPHSRTHQISHHETKLCPLGLGGEVLYYWRWR